MLKIVLLALKQGRQDHKRKQRPEDEHIVKKRETLITLGYVTIERPLEDPIREF